MQGLRNGGNPGQRQIDLAMFDVAHHRLIAVANGPGQLLQRQPVGNAKLTDPVIHSVHLYQLLCVSKVDTPCFLAIMRELAQKNILCFLASQL